MNLNCSDTSPGVYEIEKEYPTRSNSIYEPSCDIICDDNDPLTNCSFELFGDKNDKRELRHHGFYETKKTYLQNSTTCDALLAIIDGCFTEEKKFGHISCSMKGTSIKVRYDFECHDVTLEQNSSVVNAPSPFIKLKQNNETNDNSFFYVKKKNLYGDQNESLSNITVSGELKQNQASSCTCTSKWSIFDYSCKLMLER